MTKSVKLLLAGALVVASFGVAHAETGKSYVPNTHAVVRDARGNPVMTKDGECVRTMWDAGEDACAPKMPAPAPVMEPIAREDRTVYFAFNKATLTPEAKSRLDSLVGAINARGPVKAVHVAGYADRIGNAAYNEKLSKKRADAVREYLMAKGIVAADVVETRWFGDSIAAANCPKKLKRAEKIACMQPDRRVEVEIDFAAPGEAVAAPIPSAPAATAPAKHHHHKKHKEAPKQ